MVFFGIVGFPEGFFDVLKNLRENQQNTYPRVGLKPLKTLFLLVFPKVFLCFLKTIGKTFGKTNKTYPNPWDELRGDRGQGTEARGLGPVRKYIYIYIYNRMTSLAIERNPLL